MGTSALERRRHRRIDLPVRVTFRSVEDPTTAPPIVGEAKDVGLAGVHVVVPAPFHLAAGTAVTYSIEIPQNQQRRFPFSRLLGTGWIVRAVPESGEPTVGVAIAFTSDVTALSSLQP